MKFQCSSCGACCRRAGKMGIMPQREDGACIHLSDDNKCKIYDTRPDICKVAIMAERNKEALGMNTLEYFKWSNSFCNQWIKEDQMDDSYLINIGEYGANSTA